MLVNDELIIGMLGGVVFIVDGRLGVARRSGAVGTTVAVFITVVFDRFETARRTRSGIRIRVIVWVVAIRTSMVSGGDTSSPPGFVRAANLGLTDAVFPWPPDVDDGRGVPICFRRAASTGSDHRFGKRVVAGTRKGCDSACASKERHDPSSTALD